MAKPSLNLPWRMKGTSSDWSLVLDSKGQGVAMPYGGDSERQAEVAGLIIAAPSMESALRALLAPQGDSKSAEKNLAAARAVLAKLDDHRKKWGL